MLSGDLYAAEGDSQAAGSRRSNLLPFEQQAKKDPRICPVCGKPWVFTTNKDPHEQCYAKLMPETHPVRCGNCGQLLIVQKKIMSFSAKYMDRDLCPHPPYSLKPLSELILCPKCGFSATETIHHAKTNPEQKNWIRDNLTGKTQAELMKLLSLRLEKFKLDPKDCYLLFVDPDKVKLDALKSESDRRNAKIKEQQVPEYLRCRNALEYSKRFYANSPATLARYAWLTAWAYRRRVCAPLTDTFLMKAAQPIENELIEKFPVDATPKNHSTALADMYLKPVGYTQVQKCVMLLMLAGNYQRSGFGAWADDCYRRLDEQIRSQSIWAAEKARIQKERPGRSDELDKLLKSSAMELNQNCTSRRIACRAERYYLAESAKYLREALSARASGYDTVAISEIPSFVYLCGEFDRRVGNFGRANAWLKSASRMVQPEGAGVEIWSKDQIKEIKDILQSQMFPENPNAREDAALLSKLEGMFNHYYDTNRNNP